MLLFSMKSQLGKIQITDDGYLQQTCPFDSSEAWRIPISSVTSIEMQFFERQRVDALFLTQDGDYIATMLPKAKIREFIAYFPGIPINEVEEFSPIARWFADDRQRSHIGVYTDMQTAQHDLEAAVAHGWMIQGQSTTAGKVSAAKIIVGGILLGPLGALLGAGRSKDTITLTFVRTPEWLAAHPLP